MTETRMTVDIAPRAIVKILAAMVIVWLWLNLWQLLMLIVMSVVLAISLDPLVDWLCRRGIARAVAAPAIVLILAALGVGFFIQSGSELAGQANVTGDAPHGGGTGCARARANGNPIEVRAPGQHHHT